MKKTFLSLIAFLVGMVSLFAQTNPNRVLLTDKTGNTTGFLAERLDSIWFARVEGRIAAEIEYLGFTQGDGTTPDKVQVAITRTSGCEAFRIDCLLKSRADLMGTEAALAAYLDQSGSEYYWQDFTGADLSGYEFTPDVEYSIVTVGYDKYGIACGVERVDFRTPKKPLVGDCTITYDVTEKTKDAVTISFTPASGVAGYAACMFNAGQAEEQFEQMGAMFGFTTLGDYVKAFGFNGTEAQTFTWTSNDPGTDYEIYVQAWDVNGTYADMLVIPVTTDNIGGTGVAEMTIEIGAFQGDAINGYYQIVTYTPNEHTSMHRDIIIEKEGYDKEWTEDKITEYLKTDIPEDPYWNQYGVDEAYWNADPSTDYIAFSIGVNINDEWGPLERVDFTTPASPANVAPTATSPEPAGSLPARVVRHTTDGKAFLHTMVRAKTLNPTATGLHLTGD